MKFVNKKTGEVLNSKKRRVILHTVLSSVYLQFMLQSDALKTEVERYKNCPLVPYEMTERDKNNIAANPDYVLDIPRFIVKGYDKAVSRTYFDQTVWNEFWDKYTANSPELMKFINKYHPVFRAVPDSFEPTIIVNKAKFISMMVEAR